MGIYQQPNKWQCGPFALKHALLVHGIMTTERELSKAAGSTWHGTDENQLARAARRYGCELLMIRRLDPERARLDLARYLRKGFPCLLCIEEWGHWVTAVKEEKGQFILLDSQEPEVIVIAGWTKLRRMWVYHEPDEYDEETVHTVYDLHPVLPKGRVRTRARFSLQRARYLRRASNQTLARLWDVYVDDLLAICRPRDPRSEHVITFGEFLRRHGSMILDQLEFWHGDIERPAAKKILDHFRLVAETYRLVVHQTEERRAIAALGILLALWASGAYGMDPIYRIEPEKQGR